jgi:hypothetical protein
MAKLSDLVEKDYKEELETIREAGNLGAYYGAVGIGLIAIWLSDTFLFGDLWNKHNYGYAFIAFLCIPPLWKTWEQCKVIFKLHHEREVRIELKVDALLGLVNIKDEK